MPQTNRAPLSEILAAYPGKWVAVDRRTHRVVFVEETPYKLAAKIRSERVGHVAVVRAPDPTEPELIGLG